MTEKSKKEGLKEIPDVLWENLKKLLPQYSRSRKGGRPRSDLRNVMNGILYVSRTGCQQNMIPREFGAGPTCHRYCQE